jgi:Putative zinc-finger
MSGQILKFDDTAHRTVDAVLPWFANGTLTGDELAVVEQHLRECPRCRREVNLLRQLHAFCAVDEPAPDPTPSYRRLRERMGGRWPLAAAVDRLRGLPRRWQLAPGWARWAIVAQFAGIVVLGAWVAAPGGESPVLYQTLGAPAARAPSAGSIAVVFVPEVTASELLRIVRTVGASVVDGPTASNAYVLQVPAGQRDAVLAALRSEPAVALAQPLTAQPDR